MQYPNKFISNSDYASTPAPLEGAKTIDLTIPANTSVNPLEIKKFIEQVSFDKPFDSISYIISCDELPDITAYNSTYRLYDMLDIYVYIKIQGNVVSLISLYTDIIGGTCPTTYHFHTVVIPIKSPFEQS